MWYSACLSASEGTSMHRTLADGRRQPWRDRRRLQLPLPLVWSGRTVHDAWRGTPAAVHDGVLTAVPGRQAAIFASRGGQP
jgi:hypothetical protein